MVWFKSRNQVKRRVKRVTKEKRTKENNDKSDIVTEQRTGCDSRAKWEWRVQMSRVKLTLFRGGLNTSYSGGLQFFTELIVIMVTDIHKLIPKFRLGWRSELCIYHIIIMQNWTDFRSNQAKLEVHLNR